MKITFFFFFPDPVNWDNLVICIGGDKGETDCSAVNSFLNFTCSYSLKYYFLLKGGSFL